MEADARQFNWQKSAACNGVPSYIFFPDERKLPGFRENPAYIGRTYKDFCEQCRVRSICKEFAVLHNAWGVWGNTQKTERDNSYLTEERIEMREYKAEVGSYIPLWGERELEDIDWEPK